MNTFNAYNDEITRKIEEELNKNSIKYKLFKDCRKNEFSNIDLIFSHVCSPDDILLNGFNIPKLSINKMDDTSIKIDCNRIEEIYFYECSSSRIELFNCSDLKKLELFACDNLDFFIKDNNDNKISLCAWDMREFNYNGYETNRFSENTVFERVSYFDLNQLVNFRLNSKKYLLEEANSDDLNTIEFENIAVEHINTIKLDCQTSNFQNMLTLINSKTFYTNLVISNINIDYFCVSNPHIKRIEFENINIDNLLIQDCNLNSVIINNGQIDRFKILNSSITVLSLYSDNIVNLNIDNSIITNYSVCSF